MEEEPLIQQRGEEIPALLSMSDDSDTHDQNARSVLFDRTRRFYDTASQQKVRNQAQKECLCEILFCTTCMCCVGGCLGGAAGAASSCGTKQCVVWLCGGTGLCGGSGFLASIMTFPQFYAADIEDTPNKVAWKDRLRIPKEMRELARDTEQIFMPKDALQKLLNKVRQKDERGRDDCPWPCLGRVLSCYYRKEKQLVETIRNRMALHADAPQGYITEKELFTLIEDLSDYDEQIEALTAYAHIAQLARNGWLSFTKTEKYSLACKMHHFDTNTLPESIRAWYCHNYGPIVYLPRPEKMEQFGKYYQFNRDAEYATVVQDEY